MATNLSTSFTSTQTTDVTQQLYDKQLLRRGSYLLVHNTGFMKKPLSKNQGKAVNWRRYNTPSVATTALVEGVNPTGHTKTKTDIQATLAIYGDYIRDTDFLLNTQIENLRAENVSLMAQQMGETFDALARDELANATTRVFANGAGESSVTDVVDRNDLDRTLRTLRQNLAVPFVPMLMPGQANGQGAIEPGYWCTMDEDVAFDLRLVDGFMLAAEYTRGGAVAGEFGGYRGGLRFLSSPNGYSNASGGGSSTNVKNTAGTVNTYSIFCVGRDAVAEVDLGIGNGGVITHDFGSAGTADPLDVVMTTGWKKYYVAKILNDNFMAEIVCAASL